MCVAGGASSHLGRRVGCLGGWRLPAPASSPGGVAGGPPGQPGHQEPLHPSTRPSMDSGGGHHGQVTKKGEGTLSSGGGGGSPPPAPRHDRGAWLSAPSGPARGIGRVRRGGDTPCPFSNPPRVCLPHTGLGRVRVDSAKAHGLLECGTHPDEHGGEAVPLERAGAEGRRTPGGHPQQARQQA